jgi:hypothetical protein
MPTRQFLASLAFGLTVIACGEDPPSPGDSRPRNDTSEFTASADTRAALRIEQWTTVDDDTSTVVEGYGEAMDRLVRIRYEIADGGHLGRRGEVVLSVEGLGGDGKMRFSFERDAADDSRAVVAESSFRSMAAVDRVLTSLQADLQTVKPGGNGRAAPRSTGLRIQTGLISDDDKRKLIEQEVKLLNEEEAALACDEARARCYVARIDAARASLRCRQQGTSACPASDPEASPACDDKKALC